MVKRYVVSLSAEEKALLESMLKSGTERVRKMTHARILLRANDGWTDQEIREALDVRFCVSPRLGSAGVQLTQRAFDFLQRNLSHTCSRTTQALTPHQRSHGGITSKIR